jgi:hypothetical protein
VKLQLRGGLAACAIAGSVLIAAGCGGDSGSSDAAKDAAALDYVPDTAIAYVTVNTDFSGDAWERFGNLAKALDPDFEPVGDQLADQAAEGDGEVDFEQDVEPWLGESGGAAVLSVDAKAAEGGDAEAAVDGAEAFIWLEVADREAFDDFAKKRDFTEGDTVGDFTLWTNKDEDGAVAVSDDLAFYADSEEQLTSIVEFDGDSITSVDGIDAAIDGVDLDDALATVVVNGEGVREAAKSDDQLKSLADLEQLDGFEAMALGFGAEEDGMRIDGNVALAEDGDSENIKHDVFMELPETTVLAVGGVNLGGLVKGAVEGAGESNPQIQQGAGALSAVLGVTIDDLADAMDGEFALGVSAADEGLGALAGGVAGAAMGGGLGAVDPAQLVQAGTVVLAFAETGSTGETLSKVVGGAGALTGAAVGGAKASTKEGDFTVTRTNIQGVPAMVGTSEDIAAVEVGADLFKTWGSAPLSENEAFTAAWETAGVPDESVSVMWLDAGRVGQLAGLDSGNDAQLGGLVGWTDIDGKNYHIGAFLHVEIGE